MYTFSSLLKSLASLQDIKFVVSGVLVWIGWKNKLPTPARTILSGFGGWALVEENEQGLWFFSSHEALMGLARLENWAKSGNLNFFAYLFAGKLLVGERFQTSASLQFEQLFYSFSQGREIWVHTDLQKQVTGLPGISFRQVEINSDLPGNWGLMEFSAGHKFNSSLKWLFVVQPLGKQDSSEGLKGSKKVFRAVLETAQSLSCTFLRSGSGLVVVLDNLSLLKRFCQIILRELSRKQSDFCAWPCLMVIIEKGRYSLSKELINRLSLDWARFAPYRLYLPLKEAFILGQAFQAVQGDREPESISDFISLAFVHKTSEKSQEGLILSIPRTFLAGNSFPCFYCGLKNHAAIDCPSKKIHNLDRDIERRVMNLSIKKIAAAFIELDRIYKQGNLKWEDFLHERTDVSSIVHAFWAINSAVQFRVLKLIWKTKENSWPDALRQIADDENEHILTALESIRRNDFSVARRNIEHEIRRSSKNFKPRTLQGFIAMEEGSLKQAFSFWDSARSFAYTPLQQAYHFYLQGRLLEIQGEFASAINLYCNASNLCTGMLPARYRQGVCLVQQGFTDQALPIFEQLITQEGHYFNQLLIDPELARGHAQILNYLSLELAKARKQGTQAGAELKDLYSLVNSWLSDEDLKAAEFKRRLDSAASLKGIDNFAAYSLLIAEVRDLSQEVKKYIHECIKGLKQKKTVLAYTLKEFQLQASWFPFPRLLGGFYKECQRCAKILSQINVSDLPVSGKFKQAAKNMQQASELLQHIKRKLKILYIFRDFILFMLFLGKSFLVLEIFSLMAGGVIVASIHWLAREGFWTFEAGDWGLARFWGLGTLFVFTVAALWTFFRFEKKRNILMDKQKKGTSK